jgi:hypothetical protein
MPSYVFEIKSGVVEEEIVVISTSQPTAEQVARHYRDKTFGHWTAPPQVKFKEQIKSFIPVWTGKYTA